MVLPHRFQQPQRFLGLLQNSREIKLNKAIGRINPAGNQLEINGTSFAKI